MKVYCVLGQIGTDQYYAYEELVKIFRNKQTADDWITLIGKFIPNNEEYPDQGLRYSYFRIEEMDIEYFKEWQRLLSEEAKKHRWKG